MKLFGLFFIVFAIVAINKLLGFSDQAMLVGVVIGAGSYAMSQNK